MFTLARFERANSPPRTPPTIDDVVEILSRKTKPRDRGATLRNNNKRRSHRRQFKFSHIDTAKKTSAIIRIKIVASLQTFTARAGTACSVGRAASYLHVCTMCVGVIIVDYDAFASALRTITENTTTRSIIQHSSNGIARYRSDRDVQFRSEYPERRRRKAQQRIDVAQ
jgi:hypothetical protein